MSPGKALQIAGAALSTDLAFTNFAADSFRRHHRRPADAGSNSVCGRAESRMTMTFYMLDIVRRCGNLSYSGAL